HTRLQGDRSSDVCSSDLSFFSLALKGHLLLTRVRRHCRFSSVWQFPCRCFSRRISDGLHSGTSSSVPISDSWPRCSRGAGPASFSSGSMPGVFCLDCLLSQPESETWQSGSRRHG